MMEGHSVRVILEFRNLVFGNERDRNAQYYAFKSWMTTNLLADPFGRRRHLPVRSFIAGYRYIAQQGMLIYTHIVLYYVNAAINIFSVRGPCLDNGHLRRLQQRPEKPLYIYYIVS